VRGIIGLLQQGTSFSIEFGCGGPVRPSSLQRSEDGWEGKKNDRVGVCSRPVKNEREIQLRGKV
jgi:hypothetical protein